MSRIAILTSLEMAELQPYDIEMNRQLNAVPGISAEKIIWETEQDKLKNFDVALFRTTWGYHEKINDFTKFLNYLESLNIKVLNPVHIIRENLNKNYLKKLSESGINIIPTQFLSKNETFDLNDFISTKRWKQFILKPQISAGSYQTFLFDSQNIDRAEKQLGQMLLSDNVLLQEFIPEVKEFGEFSTIYFNTDTHYTINKTPKKGDYRVQYQYGGIYKRVTPDKLILERSTDAASLFLSDCLYVRVDGLFYHNDFYIMEVELIEPDLYLNLVPEFIPLFIDELINRIS